MCTFLLAEATAFSCERALCMMGQACRVERSFARPVRGVCKDGIRSSIESIFVVKQPPDDGCTMKCIGDSSIEKEKAKEKKNPKSCHRRICAVGKYSKMFGEKIYIFEKGTM
jgi:hypothetical protein